MHLLAFLILFSFEDAKIGELPPGWIASRTGQGPGSEWKVLEAPAAPDGKHVLAQVSAEGKKSVFNLCIAPPLPKDKPGYDQPGHQDIELRVKLKAVAGKIDQGGGPVWRLQDEKNYYIARLNPLESNFRVYKVVDGKRTQLATADTDAPAGRWHEIRIVHKGDHIQCYLNDKLLLEATDGTFSAAGKIGLWTKADAVTHFDALEVEPAH